MKQKLQKTINNLLLVITLLVIGKAALAQVPTITSFSPTKDTVGASVTITGTNFSTVVSNNIVFFGATKAIVNSANATSLVVIVPSGATYGSISVINLGTNLSTTSIAHFSCKITASKNSVDSTEFENKINLNNSTYYSSTAIGDIDDDGKLDIATTDYINDNFSIIRNTSVIGIVSFDYKIEMTNGTNSQPTGVSLTDINGDGKLDLIVTNYGFQSVSIYKNISTVGNINFATKVSFSVGMRPIDLDVKDIDDDGKPEIVSTNVIGNSISILKNNSTLSTINFATKIDIATNSSPREISINDINADGKKDIIVVNASSNNVSVYKNTSTLTSISFAAKVDFTTGLIPTGIAVGDVDGDGKFDLAVANSGSNSISVFKNIGTGINLSFAAKVDFAVNNSPKSVAFCDINGDGKLDLIDNFTNILRNTSSVGFITSSSFANKVQIQIFGTNAEKVLLGDLDGDKLPDLIWGQFVIRNNAILANNANLKNLVFSSNNIAPTFVSAIKNYTSSSPKSISNISLTPTLSNAGSLLKYRINGGNYTLINSGSISSSLPIPIGNSVIEIYVKSADSTCANVYSTIVNRTDTPPIITSIYPLSDTVGASLTITGTNFNSMASKNIVFFGATKAPIISCTTNTLIVTVPLGAIYGPISIVNSETMLFAYSKSKFTPKFKMIKNNFIGSDFKNTVNFQSGNEPRDLTIGDLDGDGKPEIININIASDSVSVYKNNSINGNLNITTKIDFLLSSFPYLSPSSIVLADLNNDGKLDIITSNSNNNTISVLRNTSTLNNISFSKYLNFDVVTGPLGLAIGDLNGDGKLDIVLTNSSSFSISVLKNTGSNGNISFESQPIPPTYSSTTYPTIGDLDGDGKLDIAFTNSSYDQISIYRNISTIDSIILAPQINYTTYYGSPKKIIMCDLDGDGKLDIAASTISGISVFKNNSSIGIINFAAAFFLKGGSYSNHVTAADLNGDGKVDLACSNEVFYLYRNKSTVGNLSSSSFTDSIRVPTGLNSAGSPNPLIMCDIDGDGKPDLLAVNYSTNKLYIFKNYPVPATNAGLINIIPSKGTLSPNFDSTILSYKMALDYADSNISFNPIESEENEIINIRINNGNYQYISNDSTSNLLSLYVGDNTIEIKVMAQDSIAIKTYIINIKRMGMPPTILSFSPVKDTIGATITILGSNFNPIDSNNIVYFGPVKATINNVSTTSLTVTVPRGATYSPITVLNTAFSQIAYSRLSFNPMYNPHNDSILSSNFTGGTIIGGNNFYTSDYVAIGDLNLDGKPDLVSAPFSISKNISSGNTISFEPKINFSSIGSGQDRVVLKDIDGDGKLDIVVNSSGQVIKIRRNRSLLDSFIFDNQVSINTINSYTAGEIVVQDLDGDGKPEIVYISSSSNKICILKNNSANGVISFNSTIFNISLVTIPKVINAADIDNDGKLDLIVTNNNDSIISVLRNTSTIGSLNFSTKLDYRVSYYPESIVVGDINGDGKVDIATANYFSKSFSVLKNTTIGNAISFATKIDFQTDSFTRDIKIGDINGDGLPDITTLHYSSVPQQSSVNIFRNASTITNIEFANRIKLPFAYGSDQVYSNIWDLNGDAKPEIVYTFRATPNIYYFQNNPTILHTNANLSNLSLSSGIFSPNFNKDSIVYTKSVSNTTSSLTVTPFKEDSLANIQVRINNGAYSNIASGVTSNPLLLLIGINTINIKVTAQNGITIKIYTVKVNRTPLTNASLQSLSLINTSFSPIFSTNILVYSASVIFKINNIRVSSIVQDTTATIMVKVNNGSYMNVLNKDTSNLLPLNIGINNLLVKVTAQDTSIIKIYTLVITRAAPIPPSAMSYSPSNFIAIRNVSNVNSSVTYSGDSITGFSITPSLPNGVSLNTLTGRLSGIPTVTMPLTTYTITGTNNGGSTTASFRLTVNRVAPKNLKYSDSIVVATRTITNINSAVTYTGDSIASFSITPALPTGISLNTTTGLISGISTVTLPQTVFTITGTNNGGITTASFRLTVNRIAPSNLKYNDSIVVASSTITNISSAVTYSGDSITSFSISPSLPTGVSINTTTGLISGIPTVLLPQTIFTITGTNNGGNTTASFTLTVKTALAIQEVNNTFSNINFKPNPFTNILEISFKSNTKETSKLIIIDAVGKEVFVKNIQSNIGENTITIDEITYLKSGIYFARLANNNGLSQAFKLVKE